MRTSKVKGMQVILFWMSYIELFSNDHEEL
jgi:hypothetical protein